MWISDLASFVPTCNVHLQYKKTSEAYQYQTWYRNGQIVYLYFEERTASFSEWLLGKLMKYSLTFVRSQCHCCRKVGWCRFWILFDGRTSLQFPGIQRNKICNKLTLERKHECSCVTKGTKSVINCCTKTGDLSRFSWCTFIAFTNARILEIGL